MLSQNFLAVMGVVAGVLVLAWAIWMIYIGVKYRANQDVEIKLIITKAKACSSYVLWFMLIVWGLVSSYIGAQTTLTVSQVQFFIMLLLGIQCVIEMFAFVYYKDELKKKTESVVE